MERRRTTRDRLRPSSTVAHMLAFKNLAERTSAAFRRELMAIGERLSTDGNFLAAVMACESGFRPEATNPTGGATGLIQFMPATARHLGTTTDALRGMTAEEQLPYVEAYYAPFAGRLHSATDAYMATFLPKYVGQPTDTVLATDPEIIYVQNKGFDHEGKGFITVGDVGLNAESAMAYAAAHGETDDRPDDLWWEDPLTVGPLAVLAYLGLRALFPRIGN